MCSILIHAKPDAGGPVHPSIAVLRSQRGWVVDLHEDDDFFWGHAIHGEEDDGLACVVKVPDATVAELHGLVMGREETPEFYMQKRTNIIDLDALEAKCRRQRGTATCTVFDRPELRDGKIERSTMLEMINVTFLKTDKATLLSLRRTLKPTQKTDVL